MSEAAKNRRSFSMAYLLAQCAPPLKLPDKQPTAYSYNGVVLPEFPKPENDALISFLIVRSENESEYQLLCSSKEFVRIHYSGDYYYFISRSDVQCKYSFYYPKDGYWSELYNFTGTSASTGYATKMQYVWSSHDVYNEDGTLFATASDPVPVY